MVVLPWCLLKTKNPARLTPARFSSCAREDSKRSKNRPSFYAWPTLTVKNQQKGLSTTIADKVALLTVMPPWVSRLSMVTTTLKLQHSSSQISQSHTEKLNVSFSPTDEASLEKVHTGPIGKAVG